SSERLNVCTASTQQINKRMKKLSVITTTLDLTFALKTTAGRAADDAKRQPWTKRFQFRVLKSARSLAQSKRLSFPVERRFPPTSLLPSSENDFRPDTMGCHLRIFSRRSL